MLIAQLLFGLLSALLLDSTNGSYVKSVTIASRCYDCAYNPLNVDTADEQKESPEYLTGSRDKRWAKSPQSPPIKGFRQCSLLRLSDQSDVSDTSCTSGTCFIRHDPNGLVYRGCADEENLPNGVTTNSSCTKDSKSSSVWWFCKGNLCNGGTFGSKDICSNMSAIIEEKVAIKKNGDSLSTDDSRSYWDKLSEGESADETFTRLVEKAGYNNGESTEYGGTGLTSEESFRLYQQLNGAKSYPPKSETVEKKVERSPVDQSAKHSTAFNSKRYTVPQDKVGMTDTIENNGAMYTRVALPNNKYYIYKILAPEIKQQPTPNEKSLKHVSPQAYEPLPTSVSPKHQTPKQVEKSYNAKEIEVPNKSYFWFQPPMADKEFSTKSFKPQNEHVYDISQNKVEPTNLNSDLGEQKELDTEYIYKKPAEVPNLLNNRIDEQPISDFPTQDKYLHNEKSSYSADSLYQHRPAHNIQPRLHKSVVHQGQVPRPDAWDTTAKTVQEENVINFQPKVWSAKPHISKFETTSDTKSKSKRQNQIVYDNDAFDYENHGKNFMNVAPEDKHTSYDTLASGIDSNKQSEQNPSEIITKTSFFDKEVNHPYPAFVPHSKPVGTFKKSFEPDFKSTESNYGKSSPNPETKISHMSEQEMWFEKLSNLFGKDDLKKVDMNNHKDGDDDDQWLHSYNPCNDHCKNNPSALYPHPMSNRWFVQCGPASSWMKDCQCCKPYYVRCPDQTFFHPGSRVCRTPGVQHGKN